MTAGRGARRRRRRSRSRPARWSSGWRTPAGTRPPPTTLHDDPQVQRVLAFAATQVVPRLARTTDELDAVLHALDGGFVPAGPSGLAAARAWSTCCRPAATSTPSTRARCRRGWPGRPARRWPSRWSSATSTRPAATPSRSGCRCGAPARCAPPATTSPRCSRCSASARSGTRRRGGCSDLHVVPLEELGRPRIDVTVRISGFFRDAFPHVVAMLDDAVQLVAGLDEPLDQNFVRAHAQADLAEHGDERRATTRIFGSKPGSYGAGILQVIESGTWRDDQDLAEVYTAWGGFAYGRGLDGVAAQPTTCAPTTGGSRSRPRTSTPASTTSPTATTTSSTTAAWSPPCAR